MTKTAGAKNRTDNLNFGMIKTFDFFDFVVISKL
jgi:hypothetical protein